MVCAKAATLIPLRIPSTKRIRIRISIDEDRSGTNQPNFTWGNGRQNGSGGNEICGNRTLNLDHVCGTVYQRYRQHGVSDDCYYSVQAWRCDQLMHRPIGSYQRSKYRKSLTFARYLLYVYFRLMTAHCLCRSGKNKDSGLGLVLRTVHSTRVETNPELA